MTTEQNADSNFNGLKTTRESSGLTLKDLFERTRISVVNLEAIEKGDFNALPVPIYTKNFIKTYADALGVDSKPVLQRYENYLQTLQMREKVEKITEQHPNSSLVTILSRYKAYMWVLGIIFVLAAVSLFVNSYNKAEPEAPQKTEAPKEPIITKTKAQNAAQAENLPIVINLKEPEALIAAQASGEKNQSAQTTPEAQSPGTATTPSAAQENNVTKIEAPMDDEESSVLVVLATEETWIRIQADDKEPFQVLIKPGEKISHQAARFNVDIGNAGGVRVQFNGKNLENLGKSGQVIHLRLP